MKRNLHSLGAIAALTLAAGLAHAGPTTHHTTNTSHNTTDEVWLSDSTWDSNPNTVANSADLNTSWTLDDPADISTHLMFDYTLMDDAMNTISHYTQSDVLSYSVETTRSALGTPEVLDYTIESRVLLTADLFAIELAAPVTVTMHRTGYIAADQPGLFLAQYEGVISEMTTNVTDLIGGVTGTFVSEGGVHMGLEILTSVPTPGTLAIAGLGLMLGSKRKR